MTLLFYTLVYALKMHGVFIIITTVISVLLFSWLENSLNYREIGIDRSGVGKHNKNVMLRSVSLPHSINVGIGMSMPGCA